ncbi:hypothetical protein Tco_1350543, partial [Tanacetum coccineum]
MCKQAEQGVPLQAEQVDWLTDTDDQPLEVLPEESSSTDQPLEQVQNHDENNVFANERRHSEQPESINDTYVLKKDDSNVTPDSSNICTNDNQVDQNAAESVDERAALANLIANLTLDTEKNKTILKQLNFKLNKLFNTFWHIWKSSSFYPSFYLDFEDLSVILGLSEVVDRTWCVTWRALMTRDVVPMVKEGARGPGLRGTLR